MASSNDNQSNPKFSFDLNIPNPPNEQPTLEIDGSIPVTITQTTSHGTRLLDLNMEPGCESPILELDVDGLQEEEDFEFPILGFDNDEDLIPTPNPTPNPGDCGGGVKNMVGWTNCETQEFLCQDVNPFSSQLPPVDLRVVTNCGFTVKKKFVMRKALSRETISKYFYMPIKQAARELSVGQTQLKKRCRDLGIPRWPNRKLNSIQDLIKNVQESGREGSSSGKANKLNEYLRVLEQEKKMLEEFPDMRLEVGTKRLRQDFFKANYKKRKLLAGFG